ncbi:FMN-dependent NADH-azoreductase [Ruminococcus sp. YRD2003]|uniref:NAD(P)H-dependent oxidoreductase n=1 Tax=Ruminococcus sp. YRD2003 TaxID=1452313 RepID=UPI0008D3528C|nr:FMN-dependent NADH-azoreductase [Ruminococcus flavefaciens]
MILYINSCVRKGSRTDRLARAVLEKMGEYTELFLPAEDISPLTEEMLEKRTELLASGAFDAPMLRYARQFAEADRIVISAPFWDGSFPSLLKVYIENIYAVGIVSRYGADGMPIGMCKADELIYVTTAGGPYIPDFSYGYIKAVAETCFGIKKTKLIKAEMLDIEGMDAEKILTDAIDNIPEMGV